MQEAFDLMAALRRAVSLNEDVAAQYAAAGALLIEHGFAREAARMAEAVSDHQARVDSARDDLTALEGKYGSDAIPVP